MNNKIAIIGASYLQLPLIRTAKQMGYETHVFAWALGADGEKEADFFYPISITEKEEILSICRELDICGICSIASDLAIVTVNYVSNQLGLKGNSINCSQISTNKHLMRQAFESSGLPSPRSFAISDPSYNIEKLDLTYPIIVKPTDRSGSRGIYRIDYHDVETEKKALELAMDESFENKAVVEEFIDGTEYSVEYISYNGAHHFLQITKKFTTGSPNYIETGHLEASCCVVDSLIAQKIRTVVEQALDALEITNGASHSEIKIDNEGKVWLIEVASRMGGDMIGSFLVKETTGVDFTKAVIDIAVGKDPCIDSYRHIDNRDCDVYAGIKYLFDYKDEQRFQMLKTKYPEIVLTHHMDETIRTQVKSSAERAGFYLVRFHDRKLINEIFV